MTGLRSPKSEGRTLVSMSPRAEESEERGGRVGHAEAENVGCAHSSKIAIGLRSQKSEGGRLGQDES